MINERLGANVLGVKVISNIAPSMAAALKLKPEHRSLGVITTTCDDVTYVALDAATKSAEVEVVYARSFYGGADNATTKLAGEVIGILAGPSPAEIKSGLAIVIEEIENGASFYSANAEHTIPYFAHCVSRTGTYLAKEAGVTEGEALAYLIAPPLEAMYALDTALKAADVTIASFFAPPSETNFGGALLTGSQSACKAACDAFAGAVQLVAENPLKY